MKKHLFFGLAALLALSLSFTGCPNGTEDDSEVSSGIEGSVSGNGTRQDGVNGEVSGVVLDASTGLPLAGVTVEVAGNRYTTGSNGTYLITGIIPGEDYTISYTKDGYATQVDDAALDVDSQKYKTDDPFLEKEVLENLDTLFNAWLAAISTPTLPDWSGDTWTYQGGYYVSGEGSVVEVSAGENNGLPVFELKPLDYNYAYGQSLAKVTLNPLNAAISGRIWLLFDEGQVNALTAKGVTLVDGNKLPVKADIAVQTQLSTYIYGTGGTAADGSFRVDGVPALTSSVSLVLPGFVQEGYYFDGADLYTVGTSSTLDTFTTFSTGSKNAVSDIGDIYLLPIPNDAAYILSYTAGYAAQPLLVSDSITVTFSKPIDAATFGALISVSNSTAKGINTSGEKLYFTATWNADKTVATLTPKNKLSGLTNARLPFSRLSTTSIGDLTFEGKAEDGSRILWPASSAGGAVYTEQGLTLLSAEILAPGDPELSSGGGGLRAAVGIGGAVKLTFDKDIALNHVSTSFTFGSTRAAYKIAGKVVYVYVDKGVSGDLTYTVYATADFDDSLSSETALTGITAAEEDFKVLNNPYLEKPSPTLQDYNNSKKLDTNVKLTADNADWDKTEAIKIAFSHTLTTPAAGALVYETASGVYQELTITPTHAAGTLTFDIASVTGGIADGRKYWLKFNATSNTTGQVLKYDRPNISGAGQISFTTKAADPFEPLAVVQNPSVGVPGATINATDTNVKIDVDNTNWDYTTSGVKPIVIKFNKALAAAPVAQLYSNPAGATYTKLGTGITATNGGGTNTYTFAIPDVAENTKFYLTFTAKTGATATTVEEKLVFGLPSGSHDHTVSFTTVADAGLFKPLAVVQNPSVGVPGATFTAADTNVKIDADNTDWVYGESSSIVIEFSKALSATPTAQLYYNPSGSIYRKVNSTITVTPNSNTYTFAIPNNLAWGSKFYLTFTAKIAATTTTAEEKLVFGLPAVGSFDHTVFFTTAAEDLTRSYTQTSGFALTDNGATHASGISITLAMNTLVINNLTAAYLDRTFALYYQANTVGPEWVRASSGLFTVPSGDTYDNTHAQVVLSVPGYNSNDVKLQVRGVNTDGTILATDVETLSFTQ